MTTKVEGTKEHKNYMGNETVQMIFGLLGGLAIFIYGMNLMSEGLQKAAGERMRSILSLLTKNPLIGVIAGALTTAVLQSSSATTVMVIGFVSAGLMNLPQAISIILGANIGTTMTAQIIAFKIDDFIWPIIFIGFLMFFVAKKEKIKYIGQTIFAFGLLFLGIQYMGSVMKPLVALPFFEDMMLYVRNIPVFGVLLGTVMTVVVQSSSAVIAVLQNLAEQSGPDGVHSIIGLDGSLPILFGSNIGTTITALLATIGASTNAKRTAIAHTIFNISGTVLFIWFVPQISAIVQIVSPIGPELQVIARQIANAHTFFNVICTLIWLPFVGLLVKVVTKLMPSNEIEIQGKELQPMYLDYKILDQPVFALHLATKELSRIAALIVPMMAKAEKSFVEEDEVAIERVMEMENNIDILQDASVKYLSSLFSNGELTEHQATQVAGLMHVASDIEHMGDQCQNIALFAQDKIKNQYKFSKEALDEIRGAFEQVKEMVSITIRALNEGSEELAKNVIRQEDEIDRLEVRLRKHHMNRLGEGKCSPEFTVIYTDIIHNLEKISDYCKNVAEAVMKDINFVHE